MNSDEIKNQYLEANHAMLQAHSLINIGQEAFIDPAEEEIYNLLDVLDEKVSLALQFFENIDLFWRKDEKGGEIGNGSSNITG